MNRAVRPPAVQQTPDARGHPSRPHPAKAAGPAAADSPPPLSGRCFLFLQGLASPFHARLAQALERRGARIVKVHLCGGDVVLWPARARLYRGSLAHWPDHVARLMAAEAVTDLVLFGDCRPYHVPAIEQARRTGIGLHLFEEGYVRPGRITYERHGVNAHSDLPRTPEALLEAAATLEHAPDLPPITESFARRAAWDVAWHYGYGALVPLFPRYRRHTLVHPAVDYVGWIVKGLQARRAARRDAAALVRIADGTPYFLLPLQLEGDFQMRVHSDFSTVEQVTGHVLDSFARAAPAAARLVVKRHPYDTGLRSTADMVARLARARGIAARVVLMETGDIDPLVAGSEGVVLVNSTTAIAALQYGRPLKVLGRATYDMPGLSHQGPLDSFWTEAAPRDATVADAYRRVVIARTQVQGGFFDPAAVDRAVEGCLARILAEVDPT